jgi:dTDP-4-amino-4,6-dideoxygalactose transaminase
VPTIIPFYMHSLGSKEKKSLARSLDLPFLTTGSAVHEFEERFSSYVGSSYTIGVTSCTAAMHLSLQALGIGIGDEVITTPMTFIATTLAIIHTGATPIWVDVDRNTGNIDESKIEKYITSKTKAILPVHLYGQMCGMIEIKRIANKHNLKIVEDAAHCLEGSRDNIRIGELSDTACFSFYATKSITCGEGGAITTDNKELYEKLQMLRVHGMSKDASKRFNERQKNWDLLEYGWKYNMSNVQASLLLPQCEKIEKNREKRENIYNRYTEGFQNNKNIRLIKILDNVKHGYHLFTIQVDPKIREKVFDKLCDNGIGCTINYKSINLLSKFLELFGKGFGSYPNSEEIGESTISLPLYPKLTHRQVKYVVHSVNEATR